jgi:type 1 glutamine amidotransferase
MKQALIVWGGWDGHQPEQVATLFRNILFEENFEVTVSDKLDSFADAELMAKQDLIVPVWTMGTIAAEQLRPLLDTVNAGCGIAGCHGGMGDSFRNEVEFQHMVGGQWVAHPGNDGVRYEVYMMDPEEALTKGIDKFEVVSEKYYMHVDPAIKVHAATDFDNVQMPVIWTKTWGKGRVYYNSLGHQANIIAMPETTELMRRGFLWAAR